MVWNDRGDPLATMTIEQEIEDMPRRRSDYDDFWTSETRWKLGLPTFVRLEIPITHKSDMMKFIESARGALTRMEYEASNPHQTEHGAALMFMTYVSHANKEMKARANLLKTGRSRKSNEVD